MCAVCVCLSLPISFGCCCSSWLILSFLLLFFLSGGPVLKIHLTNPPYSKCKKGKPTKGIRTNNINRKQFKNKKTKTQPFSVSEGIHFFSSPDDIHTQDKKKDDIIIIVGFLENPALVIEPLLNNNNKNNILFTRLKMSLSHFPSPRTQHTY